MAERHSHDYLDALAALVHAVDRGLARELAPHGLVPVEFRLLRYCQGRDECTATELARALPADRSQVSRLVRGLVERGLLRRRRLPGDRRVVMLRLSDAGRELLSQVAANVSLYERMLAEGVSEREIRVLIGASRRIIDNQAAMREAG